MLKQTYLQFFYAFCLVIWLCPEAFSQPNNKATDLHARFSDQLLNDPLKVSQALETLWQNASPKQQQAMATQYYYLQAYSKALFGRAKEAQNRVDIATANRATPEPAEYGPLLSLQGYLHFNRGEIGVSTQLLTRAVDICKQSNDSLCQVEALCLLSGNKLREFDINAAFALLDKAQRLLNADSEEHGAYISLLHYLAAAHVAYGEANIALSHYQHALRLSEQHSYQYLTGLSLQFIGAIYRDLGQLVPAQASTERAIEIFKKQGNEYQMGSAMVQQADIELLLGDLRKSINIAQRALQLVETYDNPVTIAYAQLSLGEGLLTAQKNALGLKVLERSLINFEKANFKSALSEPIRALAWGYAGMGNYNKAYQLLVRHNNLIDEVYIQTTQNNVNTIRESINQNATKAENTFLQEQDNLNQLLLEEKQRNSQRQLTWIGAMSAALLGLLLAVIWLVKVSKLNRALAITDELTQSANRRHVMALGNKEFQLCKRNETQMCVMMLDIDKFKKINDSHGHDVGDQVIKRVAKLCQDTLRDSDYFGRYGGEEFIAVLPNTSIDDACYVANRICKVVEQSTLKITDGTLSITLSAGCCEFNQHSDSFNELVVQADDALYKAKAAGRNRVCIYGQAA